MLSGRVQLQGFTTQIVAGNKLVADNTVVYAVNISNAETTRYLNYNFDSIVRLVGQYYGVRADGLYLLEGSDDNGTPIDAKIKTKDIDFGTSRHKRVPYMYLDTESQTKVTTEVEGKSVASYNSGFGGRRTQLAKGPKGRYWAFEVTNINGDAMILGSLEAHAEVLRRKV